MQKVKGGGKEPKSSNGNLTLPPVLSVAVDWKPRGVRIGQLKPPSSWWDLSAGTNFPEKSKGGQLA